ncbi:putative disease resistance protein RGA4 isoform X5 [Quercus suber]|uniref:putative disease resistance protein RGA4 isoform X5 n=1 Tax=Quercus suber TaxID=58331 RepID=UPI000CE1A816|nr:putative disease resistance protein RGA4 isoform X2 [Quercus suber]
MAEGVLFDLGKEVLKVVGSLALQEIKLASGVKAELENLKSTVSTIQAVLLDAEKQGSHNNEVKDWLKKLRDVFLDADDVLDDFSTEALQHKVMTGSKMTKEHIPPLNQLPFLKSVWVDGMEALEYIEYIWIDEESVSNVLGASSSSSSKTPFFPSLSSLKLVDCPKLKGWWRNSNDDNEPHHLLLPSFPPSLSELHISNCPNLTYMPPFPYFKKPLNLWRCSWKVLEQTMKMGAATTSTYFPPLSQLQELLLEKMNDFESLPEEWLRNLVSLRQLSIRWCDGLVSLPWIGSLTSLQSLEIQSCHNLTSLPQEIRNLASLKSLSISRCPLLGQRCKRQIGEDWPFIAHVPLVEVYPQNQQEETISSGEYWPFIAHVPRVLVDGWNQQEETSSPEPSDAEPSNAEPSNAEPSDAEPYAEPSDAEPYAEPSDAEPCDAEPSDTEPTEAKNKIQNQNRRKFG